MFTLPSATNNLGPTLFTFASIPSSADFWSIGILTGDCSIVCTYLGIISPARSISILSPIQISLSSINAILCRVNLLTVAPPIITGDTIPVGLTVPVLPTAQITSCNTVSAVSVLRIFKAIANLGYLEV